MSNDVHTILRDALEGLTKRLIQRVEEELSGDPGLQVTISALFGEDWPYDLTVEVEVNSRLYKKEFVQQKIEELLEEELRKTEEELRKKGLSVMP